MGPIELIREVRRYSQSWTDTRGFGPFKQTRSSPCSIHQVHDPKCRICALAFWENHWKLCAEYALYRAAPRVWKWWVNVAAPWLSRLRRRML